MSPSKRKPARRGPASPGSPDNLKGIDQKHANPDGTTPADLPTSKPQAPARTPNPRKP
jgi:hypothetical protein